MSKNLIRIEVSTDPDIDSLTGRNGTWGIKRLVIEQNEAGMTYVGARSAKGGRINGGLYVQSNTFLAAARQFVRENSPTNWLQKYVDLVRELTEMYVKLDVGESGDVAARMMDFIDWDYYDELTGKSDEDDPYAHADDDHDDARIERQITQE